MIGKNFSYPPDSEDTDSVPTPDSVNKLHEEKTPKEEPEEQKVSPFPTACTLTQGEAVHCTGDSLSGGTSRKVLDNDSSSLPDFEKKRNSLLEEFGDVFKEDLSPQDRIKGVKGLK